MNGQYKRWVEEYDTISDPDRTAIRTHVATLAFRPIISVIMAIGGGSEARLRATIASIVQQLYPNWELCLASGAEAPDLGRLLDDFAGGDPRVRVRRLDTEDLATAWNAAIDSATGEFVTFVQPGDLLSEHALYEVTVRLGEIPLDVVYTDEDSIDASGQRCEARFKPGWDPDLLLAENYVGSLAVYRRSVIEAVGRCRQGFEGAENYDLLLRVSAMTTPEYVRHLPAVLYHRQLMDIDPGREPMAAVQKLSAAVASRRAVREHLDARGDTEAKLEPARLAPLCNRVVWPLPVPLPMVSVIVPTRDRAELLQQCAHGVLRRTDYSELELLVVDNDSRERDTHALFDRLQDEHPGRVRIIPYPGPFNFSALNNFAVQQARGEVLLLLNNDVDVIDSGWLREMVSHAIRPDVGAVGAKLLYLDETLQHAGFVLGPAGAATHLLRRSRRDDPGYGNQLAFARTLSAVTGACLAVRKCVFEEVGGLNETDLHVAFNDVDFCLRLGDYGYRVVWTPGAELFHLESASRGPDEQSRFNREWHFMRRTWGSLLENGDPYHNSNVCFHWTQTDIPSPPRTIKPWKRLKQSISARGEVR